MFVAIVNYPKIKAGQEEAFKSWFNWSTSEFSKSPGFIRRSLLKNEKEGEYACLVEMDSKESFMALHSLPFHAIAAEKALELFEGRAVPTFYSVVIQ
jgi:heme-degrading monooxygenase HmoA